MSLGTTIGSGPGNLVPESGIKEYLASAAITKGQVVSIVVSAGTASYSIVQADSDGTNLDIVVGVAKESIASGAWGEVYYKGYCPYVLTDGTVAVGDPLVPHTVAGEASVMVAGEEHIVFGNALSADTGTVEYCDALLLGKY